MFVIFNCKSPEASLNTETKYVMLNVIRYYIVCKTNKYRFTFHMLVILMQSNFSYYIALITIIKTISLVNKYQNIRQTVTRLPPFRGF